VAVLPEMPAPSAAEAGETMKNTVTSGICEKCEGPAKGGVRRRWGVDLVLLCKECGGAKSEQDLYLTHKQAETLLEAAQKSGPRVELLVTVGLNFGLRVSEIVALQVNDFDWEEGRIWVTTLKRRRHPRLPVYMSKDQARAIRKVLDTVLKQGWKGYLFPRRCGGHGWKRGGHVGQASGMKLFAAARRLSGLPDRISSHSMRHYAAINILESTGDVYWTMKQLRHSTVKTTERYMAILPSRAAALAEKVKAVKP